MAETLVDRLWRLHDEGVAAAAEKRRVKEEEEKKKYEDEVNKHITNLVKGLEDNIVAHQYNSYQNYCVDNHKLVPFIMQRLGDLGLLCTYLSTTDGVEFSISLPRRN